MERDAEFLATKDKAISN